MNAPERCIDLEALSSFVDGALDGQPLNEVIRHLSRCASCRLIVERAAELEDERAEAVAPASEGTVKWKAAFAAALILALGATFLLVDNARWRDRADPIKLMASASPATERSIEPRLSGGFRWAPFRNAMAPATRKSTQQLTAAGTAAQVIHSLKDDKSAKALHAKGIAHLLQDDPSTAVTLLRLSAQLQPNDAHVWNDLAAALYVNARGDDEWREALAAARRAVGVDPHLTEAYFNVALILERIGTKQEIQAAWNEYLRRDPSGGWSEEAKDHLAHYQARN